ncbi:hypothetical protein FRC03_008990 [Tulasnella sp. 419]|nr:hypothetical protein FRC02_007151 [Tulasnella sp. 418]KAG8967969.1 hypothetical protein FRC03_008990 [Tulasnella sp. 419]
MEQPTRRKILSTVEGSSLRPITPTIKAKVSSNAILGARNRRIENDIVRSKSPARALDKLRTSSPTTPLFQPKTTRVTSPEISNKEKLLIIEPSSPIVPKAKASSVIIAKRASISRVGSPTPSTVTTATLRSVSSSHSLPTSPPPNHSGLSLRPETARRYHYRHGSTSDASSLAATSPSAPSPPSLSPSDAPSEPERSRSSSIGGIPPSVRLKSRVSDVSLVPTSPKSVVSDFPNGLGLPSDRTYHHPSSSHSRTLSSSTPCPINAPSHQQVPLETRPNISQHPIQSTRFTSMDSSRAVSSHYQPFPIPSLPAPPPPSVIPEILSHSSPKWSLALDNSPVPKSAWSSPAAPQFDVKDKCTPELDVRKVGNPGVETSSLPAVDKTDPQTEAKTRRKIADLEITNQSLLAINAVLEETKLRQANEIRELRRLLRETRLTLPPKTYAALQSRKSSLPLSDEDNNSSDEDLEKESDPVFDRLRSMIEHMLDDARSAVSQDQQSSNRGGGTYIDRVPVVKVLSANEAKMYVEGEVSGDMLWDDERELWIEESTHGRVDQSSHAGDVATFPRKPRSIQPIACTPLGRQSSTVEIPSG